MSESKSVGMSSLSDDDKQLLTAMRKFLDSVSEDHVDPGDFDVQWFDVADSAINQWQDRERRLSELERENAELRARLRTELNEDEQTTKKEVAKQIARNKLVINTHLNGTRGGQVTTSMVRESAEPATKLSSRTIIDAFDELTHEWDVVTKESGDPGPNGDDTRLVMPKSPVDGELVQAAISDIDDTEFQDGLRHVLRTTEVK